MTLVTQVGSIIESFGSKKTEKTWLGEQVIKLPLKVQEIGWRKLQIRNNSQNLADFNIHPGEVLQEKFLTEFKLSAYRLAQDIHIPQTRLSEILKGRCHITADTALRLARYFGNSPKFWLSLQNDYDLKEEWRAH